MKKSKKLARLKRISCCGGCTYSHYVDFYNMSDDYMVCSRHHDSPCCFYDAPCSHYVPFCRFLPRKSPFYW